MPPRASEACAHLSPPAHSPHCHCHRLGGRGARPPPGSPPPPVDRPTCSSGLDPPPPEPGTSLTAPALHTHPAVPEARATEGPASRPAVGAPSLRCWALVPSQTQEHSHSGGKAGVRAGRGAAAGVGSLPPPRSDTGAAGSEPCSLQVAHLHLHPSHCPSVSTCPPPPLLGPLLWNALLRTNTRTRFSSKLRETKQ